MGVLAQETPLLPWNAIDDDLDRVLGGTETEVKANGSRRDKPELISLFKALDQRLFRPSRLSPLSPSLRFLISHPPSVILSPFVHTLRIWPSRYSRA